MTVSHFKRKSDKFHANQKTLNVTNTNFVSHVKTHSEKALKASYLVSHELALGGTLHTLTETFIRPQIVNLVK